MTFKNKWFSRDFEKARKALKIASTSKKNMKNPSLKKMGIVQFWLLFFFCSNFLIKRMKIMDWQAKFIVSWQNITKFHFIIFRKINKNRLLLSILVINFYVFFRVVWTLQIGIFFILKISLEIQILSKERVLDFFIGYSDFDQIFGEKV